MTHCNSAARRGWMRLLLLLVAAVCWSGPAQAADGTVLQAAVAKVDITPPVGTPLAGYGNRDEGSRDVRDPLHAGILIFDDGDARAAIVTLDLIGIGYEETAALREAISSRAGVPEDHILVNASHTHGSPRLSGEDDYGRQTVAKIAGAAGVAVEKLRPVTLGYDEDVITFNVNRRLVNAEGIAEMRPFEDGPVDRRVKVLRVDDDDDVVPMAVLMHVVCHANVFRDQMMQITADFPGVAQQFVEHAYHGGTKALFLQGATGDIRPNLPSADGFRNGDEADVQWAGMELGSAVVRAAARSAVREARVLRPATYAIRVAHSHLSLPGKDDSAVRIDMQAMRIGDFLFLTLPGEPFLSYALQVEERLQDPVKLLFLGYSNGSSGYIVTDDAYPYGGYEPGVSRLKPGSEQTIVTALLALAADVGVR